MQGVKQKKKKSKKNEGEEEEEEVVQTERIELKEGQILEKVRIKEINYFDGLPILSMREDIINTNSLTYDSIEIG